MSMTPREIVHELNRHIVGQDDAKRAVAIALRNRWRRMQLPAELRAEVTPKNILMIGPTGVGKTEIARRLAKLANAPFIKVEATKFTEVGYVGRDVDSIVKDLAEVAVKMARDEEIAKVRERARDAAEERILDALLPQPKMMGFSTDPEPGARDRLSGGLGRQIGRRDARLDDVSFSDAGPLQNPLIARLDQLLEIGVGENARWNVGGEAGNARTAVGTRRSDYHSRLSLRGAVSPKYS